MEKSVKLTSKYQKYKAGCTMEKFSIKGAILKTADSIRVAGVDRMVLSLELIKLFRIRSWEKSQDHPETLKELELMEADSRGEDNSIILYASLVDTKMASNKRVPQIRVLSHALLATRNYKVMVSLVVKSIRILEFANSNTAAGPNVVEQGLFPVACSSLIEQVKAICLHSACISLLFVTKAIKMGL